MQGPLGLCNCVKRRIQGRKSPSNSWRGATRSQRSVFAGLLSWDQPCSQCLRVRFTTLLKCQKAFQGALQSTCMIWLCGAVRCQGDHESQPPPAPTHRAIQGGRLGMTASAAGGFPSRGICKLFLPMTLTAPAVLFCTPLPLRPVCGHTGLPDKGLPGDCNGVCSRRGHVPVCEAQGRIGGGGGTLVLPAAHHRHGLLPQDGEGSMICFPDWSPTCWQLDDEPSDREQTPHS